jgi:hypothetical protein
MPTVLTTAERRMLDFLTGRLKAGDTRTLTYGELAAACDPDYNPRDRHFRRISQALWSLNHFEHEHQRPMIGAMVVRASNRLVGDGFYAVARELDHQFEDSEAIAFWEEQKARVIAYWTAPERQEPEETQLDRIEHKLDRIIKHLTA